MMGVIRSMVMMARLVLQLSNLRLGFTDDSCDVEDLDALALAV